MAIDLAPYEAPIKEAADKLEGDTGASDKAQADLHALSKSLADYGTRHQTEAGKLRGNWVGDRGDLFGVKAKEHTQALDDASNWASSTARTIGDATSLVKDAQQQCQALLREFDADARTLAEAAASSKDPGAEMQARAVIAGMSAKYAKEAADIVNAAKGRLQDLMSGMNATAPASAPPAGPLGSRTSGVSSGGGGGGGEYSGGGSAPSSGHAMTFPPSDQYGSGPQIKLPGGQTVNAPNERAAIAVRAALSRLGLPYVWGGTDPNRGMDCSGLTQWAYGQAGIKIPRTAATQTIGQKVDIHDIQPGDLVIWSGHVAMYIGNGQMVEEPHTGDVCHVVPLRTSNAGEPLLGVFRPSA
ncbi:C40 family peptidase [Amycolatopsis alkalitolerans]|uniref:NlpC/P60 family protein n=1 Tax=Amycolatopsis alkalitolerans TaxID=2547244 RepID=A0A5C4M6X6_9PSEU|nr:C40 family peptidase [Amycolatopsis alkalitolerans]TNC28190.1 NlpC/P60 family protein [Amycolatopsis alkalitolerans]